jgi:hypothetical protein
MAKRPVGRPEIKIDKELVFKFAQMGCKNTEIADYFGCHEETISNNFSDELAKGRAEIRMSLRQWQLKAAKEGNATMLIWLGKQMLGQKDNLELSTGEQGFKVILEDYTSKK